MTTYKMRAEGIFDVMAVWTGTAICPGRYKIEKPTKHIPDVEIEFDSHHPIEYLIKEMDRIPDTHVMQETIKPIEEYTGER